MSALKQIIDSKPVEGAQDFYSGDVRQRAWLCKVIASVLDRYGFEPWNAPLLERLSLYEPRKNLPLVQNHAFVVHRSGQEKLVLRAELTPSLSRVVSGLDSNHPFPVRWYSYGPFWRNESLRAGRGREFRQWNIDVIGAPAPLSDAELVILAIDILRALGLSSDQVKIHLNSRVLLTAALRQGQGLGAWSPILSRLMEIRARSENGEWHSAAQEAGLASELVERVEQFFDDGEGWKQDEVLPSVFDAVAALGWEDYVVYDPTIIRAAVYYTGIVFEAFSECGTLPAILGGGRYDGLAKSSQGQALPGLGFAIGDLALIQVLEKLGLMPDFGMQAPRVSVLVERQGVLPLAHRLAMGLRAAGIRTEMHDVRTTPSNGQNSVGVVLGQFVARPLHATNGDGHIAISNSDTDEHLVLSLEDAIKFVSAD